jgi:hypothetical protein
MWLATWPSATSAAEMRGLTATENILKQAYSIKDLELPMLLPGIKVNTSPTDHVPVDQMQFMRFNGTSWERFGELQTGN